MAQLLALAGWGRPALAGGAAGAPARRGPPGSAASPFTGSASMAQHLAQQAQQARTRQRLQVWVHARDGKKRRPKQSGSDSSGDEASKRCACLLVTAVGHGCSCPLACRAYRVGRVC